jgi:hypothetical protein
LDYHSLTGNFSGDSQQEYVTYSENHPDKTGQIIPIIVKSRQMNVKIAQESDKEKTPISFIKAMQADNNVTINYNQEVIAAADQAIYERSTANCLSESNNGVCQVTNQNGDIIKSQKISIEPFIRQIHFEEPKGAFYTKGENVNLNRIDFTSDSMLWDEINDTLILNKNITVNRQGMGQLNNQDEVRFFRQKEDGHKRLRAIDSLGKTVLEYVDEDKNEIHTLTCYGKVSVDHEHLQTHLTSPLDENGNVLKDKQIYFHDRTGEIYADKALISYDYIDHQIVTAKIMLMGHVYLQNRTAADTEDPGQFLQYAIADIVEYYPIKHKMYFKSERNHRVLFFDKRNNVQISSTALKILRDPNSKKESIQGLGDVRMNFIEEELDALRKRFNLQKI